MQLRDLNLSEYDTLLLDRDGVINVLRPNDYVKCWEEFVFLPGVLETLARFARTAKHIFIVTNQRGVGKGIMTEQALLDVPIPSSTGYTTLKRNIGILENRGIEFGLKAKVLDTRDWILNLRWNMAYNRNKVID